MICKICYNNYQHLGSHVYHKHGLLAKQYKKRFGLNYNTPLISEEIKQKKQKHYSENKEKYLKNLRMGKDSTFPIQKGEIRRTYFSKEDIERCKNNLNKINNQTSLLCPFCEMKYKNLNTHLRIKHNLKITKWKNTNKQLF